MGARHLGCCAPAVGNGLLLADGTCHLGFLAIVDVKGRGAGVVVWVRKRGVRCGAGWRLCDS